MAAKASARDRVLDAAESLAVKVGALHITLDAVSEAAGVSKGGLLYHFPSKNALIQAMVDRHIDRLEAIRNAVRDVLPAGRARLLKAHIMSMGSRAGGSDKVTAAIIAAAVHNPRLLDDARKRYAKAFKQYVAGGVRPERAAVIAMAMDGLVFTRLVGISPFDSCFTKRIMKELFRLADE